MTKRVLCLLACLCLAAALLCSCASSSAAMDGGYTAVNPPVDSGETVITALRFSGKAVTMISGDTQQTVAYKLAGDKFTIVTDYGEFSYDFARKDNGDITIDGVDYRKDA